jgi:hypothetical protein
MNSTKLDLMILVSQLEDPRSRTCLHNFHEIVVITICAAICGLTEWEEIYEFAVERKTWLQEKLQLKDALKNREFSSELVKIGYSSPFNALNLA